MILENILHAAKLWRQCGRWAMTRYCAANGVDLRLVRLARQLHAVRGVGV